MNSVCRELRAHFRADRLGLFGFLVICLLGLVGCAGYQLGTGSTPQFKTIFVAPVRTETLIPQAQVITTTQIREAFIRDGRVKLVDSPAEADAVLTVAIVNYDRAVAVSRSDDTGLARRYDVTLKAKATLSDTRTHKDYFNQRPLTAQRGVFTDSGQVPAEYYGLPLLAEQLALHTVSAVLDTW